MTSIVPPSRFFPAPRVPFDTEVAVSLAGQIAFSDPKLAHVSWVAPIDAPTLRAHALVRTPPDHHFASRVGEALASIASAPAIAGGTRWRGFVAVVEHLEVARMMLPALASIGMRLEELEFHWVATSTLTEGAPSKQGEALALEPTVGDQAWRAWGKVERAILSEMLAPSSLPDAMLDRAIALKRRQQRETPPVRRFVARDGHGALIGMIGYAPFAACDLGGDGQGPLVRLRDVAVLPEARRRGVGSALVRAVAKQAQEECGATQVLICGARNETIRDLYRKLGARVVGGCAMFSAST